MPEYYENLRGDWRCGEDRKWALVRCFDRLIGQFGKTEEELRKVILAESLEIATDRRDDLTVADADRVLDKFSTMLCIAIEEWKLTHPREPREKAFPLPVARALQDEFEFDRLSRN